jgi:ribosomal protein L4
MKACRNLPFVELRDSKSLDPVVLVHAEKILATKAALKSIEELLK